jgi:hydrogenase expression/formation protein HypE
MALLGLIVETMAAAARRAGVTIVTGDTKVVEQGRGDGLYINTAGIGSVAPGVHVAPDLARPGDVVIVSGPIGLHGMAVLSVREGLEFGTTIESDCAPLNGVVAAILAAGGSGVHAMRDPTRGGVAATVNEIARASTVGVVLDEASIPVPADVAAACAMLGLDVLSVANEGKVVVFAAAGVADAVLDAMRHHDLATDATVIGRVVDDHPGMVVARTGIGGRRVVDVPLGEQLPRIC